MRRSVLLLSVLTASLALPAQTAGSAPNGWILAGTKPADYRSGVDPDGTAFLASKDGATTNAQFFGTMMQYIGADNYAGKRVRFHAMVRSQGVADWAGLWMRVDRGTQAVAFDNMQNRPIKGSTTWTPYDVVLEIPLGATGIGFGTLVAGPGEVWLDQLSLEVVGPEVHSTDIMTGIHKPPAAPIGPPLAPVNLDFKH